MNFNVFFACVMVAFAFCGIAAMHHPDPKPAPVTPEQVLEAMKIQGFNIVSSPMREDYPVRLYIPTLKLHLHLTTKTKGRMRQKGYGWLPLPEDLQHEIVTTYEAFALNLWS